MTLAERARALTPEVVTDWFAAGNLGFLAVDIALAHKANNFAAWPEWIPVVFSAVAPLLLIPVLLRRDARAARMLATVIGVASMVVGLLGMVFHLESGFFEEQSIHQLVYTAPFVAPLSYVGLGLLLLLNRLEPARTEAWAEWVVLLAFGGFVGNLGLCLLDHAQNGFYSALEWVGVGAAAFGASFLLVSLFRHERRFLRICLGVMALEAGVGVLGAALHLIADAKGQATSWHDRLIYGAPVFAPLLFADLALLGAVGLWALIRQEAAVRASPPLASVGAAASPGR